MIDNSNISDKSLWDTVLTYIMVLITLFVEELIAHPFGTVVSIIGLLFAFDRWRTQRMSYKMKKLEYDKKVEENCKDCTEEEKCEKHK